MILNWSSYVIFSRVDSRVEISHVAAAAAAMKWSLRKGYDIMMYDLII